MVSMLTENPKVVRHIFKHEKPGIYREVPKCLIFLEHFDLKYASIFKFEFYWKTN